MSITVILTIAGLLFLLSVVASKLSDRYGIPSLLIFILIGMLAGSDGIGGIHFQDVTITDNIGTLALAFILFSGGFETSWPAVKPILFRGILLSTVGVFITGVLVAAFAYYVIGLSLTTAFLLGAIISSTDAPAVFSVLRSQKLGLKGRLKPILEFESGSNDPIAVFLTVSALHFAQGEMSSLSAFSLELAQEMLLGGLFGYGFGKLGVKIFNRLNLDFEGMYPVLGISIVFITYGVTSFLGGSGFLAVYLAGIVMGNGDYLYKFAMEKFFDSVSWLMQIMMFLLLGLLVNPNELAGVAMTGIGVVLFIIFIARPIAIYISLVGSTFSWRGRTFIAWTGLKGAVPIILATYPIVAGYRDGQYIFYLIFFVVLISVLLQGQTLSKVAKLLKVDKPFHNSPDYPLEFVKKQNGGDVTRDIQIDPNADVVGKKVMELGLPTGVLILLLYRMDKFLIPTGEMVIQADDTLLIFGPEEKLIQVSQILTASTLAAEE